MYDFKPLIDVNTKSVYQWTMTDAEGQQTRKDVPRQQWKKAIDWTQEELKTFFGIAANTDKSVFRLEKTNRVDTYSRSDDLNI